MKKLAGLFIGLLAAGTIFAAPMPDLSKADIGSVHVAMCPDGPIMKEVVKLGEKVYTRFYWDGRIIVVVELENDMLTKAYVDVDGNNEAEEVLSRDELIAKYPSPCAIAEKAAEIIRH